MQCCCQGEYQAEPQASDVILAGVVNSKAVLPNREDQLEDDGTLVAVSSISVNWQDNEETKEDDTAEWKVPFSEMWHEVCEEKVALALQQSGNLDFLTVVDRTGRNLNCVWNVSDKPTFGRSAVCLRLVDVPNPDAFPLVIQFQAPQDSKDKNDEVDDEEGFTAADSFGVNPQNQCGMTFTFQPSLRTADASHKSLGVDSRHTSEQTGAGSAGSWANSFEAAALKLTNFEDHRTEARKQRFYAIAAVAVKMSFIGMVIWIAGFISANFFRYQGNEGSAAIHIVCMPLGLLLISSGIVAVTTLPLEDLDIDEFLKRSTKKRLIIWLLLLVQFRGWTSLMSLSIAIIGIITGMQRSQKFIKCAIPLQSTLLAAWILIQLCEDILVNALAVGGLWVGLTTYREQACDENVNNMAAAAWLSPCFTYIFVRYMWARCGTRKGWGRKCKLLASLLMPRPECPTLALWRLSQAYLFVHGTYFVIAKGIALHLGSGHCYEEDINQFYMDIAQIAGGVCHLPPLIPILFFGREWLFKRAAGRLLLSFELSRAEEDGAFIAEILDMIDAEIGDTWWVHHGRNDERYPEWDPRRNWAKGVVTERLNDELVVIVDSTEVVAPPRTDDDVAAEDGITSLPNCVTTLKPNRPRTQSSFSNPSHERSNGSSSDKSIGSRLTSGTWVLSLFSTLKRGWSSGNFRHPQESPKPSRERDIQVFKCNIAKRGMTSKEMMLSAHRNLRCIDWEALQKYEDFANTKVHQSGEQSITGGDLFHWSRPVEANDKIDFFVSHSWHDDNEEKWKQLKSFVEEFKNRRGRYPTFWLDTFCIDQSNIAEGLKVLPVNLMSCSKMLIVSGSTYPTRLWCAWEMLTLFAFTGMDQAVQRVECIALPDKDDAAFDALECLERFDVDNARCYDPNEEARLRKVIELVGKEKFNSRIQRFAKEVRARESHHRSESFVSYRTQ